MLDVKKIKRMFPIYKENPQLTYLDSCATSLKPQCVIDKMNEYYADYGVNIHRGVYKLSYKASDEYDIARQKVAKFINSEFEEVIFTKNASEALNLVALTYGEKQLQEGDIVLTSELEHHSSVLPWMKLCQKKKAHLKYVPLDKEGRITISNFEPLLSEKVKVVALTYVSNVMGYVTPISDIIELAHKYKAVVILDAAQAVTHLKIDVKKMDVDFLAFSGHKMFGPTGIGALYGKENILKKLDPLLYGGDMNEEVSLDNVIVKEIPYRFETGTPAIAEVIGLGNAIDLLDSIGIEAIHKHTMEVKEYALKGLLAIKGVTIYNPTAETAIISFNIDGVHPHDAATIYDNADIALRAGHHCAQLMTKWLKTNGTLRGSFSIYNDYQDADKLIKTTKEAVDFFRKFAGENNE
ncbi:MAG: SufS family cysteine desulfurase [Bacilli bacterium]|nr:SufS family cysteine desulfurase [Bacilli bacterium]MDY0209655.1 SufS family cysteine desulfurase [Bacilli bacterium]